jgi:hypothetical protein
VSVGSVASGLGIRFVVLDKHRPEVASTPSPTRTRADRASLELTLLNSSPRDGTEVRKATALFNFELRKSDPLTSPAKRFAERMTRVTGNDPERKCSAPWRAC